MSLRSASGWILLLGAWSCSRQTTQKQEPAAYALAEVIPTTSEQRRVFPLDALFPNSNEASDDYRLLVDDLQSTSVQFIAGPPAHFVLDPFSESGGARIVVNLEEQPPLGAEIYVTLFPSEQQRKALINGKRTEVSLGQSLGPLQSISVGIRNTNDDLLVSEMELYVFANDADDPAATLLQRDALREAIANTTPLVLAQATEATEPYPAQTAGFLGEHLAVLEIASRHAQELTPLAKNLAQANLGSQSKWTPAKVSYTSDRVFANGKPLVQPMSMSEYIDREYIPLPIARRRGAAHMAEMRFANGGISIAEFEALQFRGPNECDWGSGYYEEEPALHYWRIPKNENLLLVAQCTHRLAREGDNLEFHFQLHAYHQGNLLAVVENDKVVVYRWDVHDNVSGATVVTADPPYEGESHTVVRVNRWTADPAAEIESR